jgi:hypothetical protein
MTTSKARRDDEALLPTTLYVGILGLDRICAIQSQLNSLEELRGGASEVIWRHLSLFNSTSEDHFSLRRSKPSRFDHVIDKHGFVLHASQLNNKKKACDIILRLLQVFTTDLDVHNIGRPVLASDQRLAK